MKIDVQQLNQLNSKIIALHEVELKRLQENLHRRNIDSERIIEKINDFQIAIPSWALGTGGTRFGRFSIGGEPASLLDKISDVGILHTLSKSAGSISLHLPWDTPEDVEACLDLAKKNELVFDAVNSNTFQDQKDQQFSYKFGSLSNVNSDIRNHAIAHNLEVIQWGEALGSKSITIWLADGSSFPGQHSFKKAYSNTIDSLQEIYAKMPVDWKMYIEYKPYEPNFYSTVISDWGTSCMMAEACGERAYTLVDLGHHLPNTNIEQIVARLFHKGRLGGFHFNDSKYGDDDLTCGSIKPYQLFLIFLELVDGMENNYSGNPDLAWMIDASHNYKDPLEDLLQSLEAINLAYAKALCLDRKLLNDAQESNDIVAAQGALQDAFRLDLRPLLAEARRRKHGALDPISAFRELQVRTKLIQERGNSIATGL